MSRYGLGIDVGAATVTAAVCAVDDGRSPVGARPMRGPLAGDGLPADPSLRLALARVGDPIPFYGGVEPRTGASVVATAVAHVREVAEAAQGEPPSWTVVAVPPTWGEHRRAELAEALAAELGQECTLASSAVAAARRHRADDGARGTVAVYDLGAESLHTAVVRPAPDGTLEHAAVPPPPHPWGGRDIDDAVLQHVRTAVGLPDTAPAPRDLARLTALRRSCIEAKERLSTELAARVDVYVAGSYESVRLVRADLDELIARSVTESVASVRLAVTEAGLTPADVDGIVLAGGSALVPLVASTLSAELQIPLFVDDRPALTVACGAAELAADLLTAVQATGNGNDEDEDDDGVPVVDLARHRALTAAQRATVRVGTVAALLAILFVTPLSLMGVLDSGVTPRSAQGVAVAEEPPASAPAAAPATTPEAAPGTTPSARRATPAAAGPTRAAPTAAPKAAAKAAPKTTASAEPTAPAPAPAAPPVPATQPVTPPPAQTPPAQTPPAETPPAQTPPAQTPPAETPPAQAPPADSPPADQGTDTTPQTASAPSSDAGASPA
jgi:actin-like ATPase involved in cell morphogenesis